MNGYDFVSAADLNDALAILSREEENACLIAGATNVINKVHIGKIRDKVLVSIDKLDELRGIREEDGYIVIGALTCMNDVAESDLIKEKGRVLWEAAQVFADPTTRNRATIGGNIADASPAADSAPPLLVLKADIIIKSLRGERIVPAEDFFVFVGKTVLKPDEIITAVRFRPDSVGAFVKMGLRNAIAISVSSAAASVKLGSDGTVEECTIALGSVAPTPVRAYNAEKALIGNKITDESLARMKDALRTDISPIDDTRATAYYRMEVSLTIAGRAVVTAAEQAA